MIKATKIFCLFVCILSIWGCSSSSSATHDTTPRDSTLGEEVIFVPLELPSESVKLQTTVFRPKQEGQHPLVIINHGANGKLPTYHLQERFRPTELAKFFLSRGYLVVAPMREGFAQSTGYCKFHCDHTYYALTYARDISAVINYFITKKEANPNEILVIGQSNGGMVTLGYAASEPVAKAIINISGGVNTEGGNCDWQAGMLNAASTLGAKTSIPSLWLYTKDDRIFPPSVSKPFYEAYNTAGGKGEMTLFSAGGHGFALDPGNEQFWGPVIDKFLEKIGLPNKQLN